MSQDEKDAFEAFRAAYVAAEQDPDNALLRRELLRRNTDWKMLLKGGCHAE